MPGPTLNEMVPTEFDEHWKKCYQYALDEFDSTAVMRARRGQTNREKILHQTAVGKLGEIYAWLHLKSLGYPASDPDFEIYKGGKKSWESDMFIGTHKVACKSQDMESARNYGRSWIFQKGGIGKGHTDPVISEGESLSMFVSLDLRGKTAEVMGPFRMHDLRPHFKPPKIARLAHIKVALYWDDIKKAPIVTL